MLSVTNEHRWCMGLEEIQDTWECVEAPNGAYWYFDEDDVIRKVIEAGDDRYIEYSLAARTIENRTKLCPKTARGKVKSLTPSAVEAASRHGVYLYYYQNNVSLGNYTNQLDYYWGSLQAGEFATAKRKHISPQIVECEFYGAMVSFYLSVVYPAFVTKAGAAACVRGHNNT